jgi:hypothetical protein
MADDPDIDTEIEYDSGTQSDIDATAGGPGISDGVQEQLDGADTLDRQELRDPLDEGWNPPDRDPGIDVPTADEEARGLSLDELLAAEVPDVGADERTPNLFDEDGDEVGDARSGRLVNVDRQDGDDIDDELWGEDVGIDGAAASAEEAAVHVIDPEDNDVL